MDESNTLYDFIKKRQFSTILLWIYIIFASILKSQIKYNTYILIFLAIITLWHIEWIIRKIIEIIKSGSFYAWWDNTQTTLKVSVIIFLILVALIIITFTNSIPLFIVISKFTQFIFLPMIFLVATCWDSNECAVQLWPLAIIINVYIYIWISYFIVLIKENRINNKFK